MQSVLERLKVLLLILGYSTFLVARIKSWEFAMSQWKVLHKTVIIRQH